MKMYVGGEYLHVFLTSALDGVEGSALFFGPFTPGEVISGTG
jgi:hypothetical protein